MTRLKQKWNNFANMIFDPWFLVFILATITSLGLSIWFKTNELFSNLLAVFGSITGGIAGGIFQNEYSKVTGENILRKKGQSAVRNLQSIQKQIGSLRCWVMAFGKKAIKDVKPQLNEIDRHLSVIELNVNSGYEDWIDIDPTLRGEKEVQEKFNETYRAFVIDLLDQKMKLAQSATTAEQEGFGKKIAQLEKQIKNMKKEKESVLFSSTTLGDNTGFSLGKSDLLNNNFVLGNQICSKCGKTYPYDFNSTSISLTGMNLCSNCKK